MTVRRVLLVAALALAACADAGPLIGHGVLSATLRSPHGDEGAAVLLLAGEGVLGVESVGQTEAYGAVSGAAVAGAATRVVLVHPTGGTLTFQVEMIDLSRPLVAVVREVAGPDDELRTELSGYRLELSR